MVIGRAIPCKSGKSTLTWSHWAWKPAERLVMTLNVWRTASRLSNPFLRPKSLRLLEQSSLRKNVANLSYCFRKACSIFDLRDGIEARQLDPLALLGGEFRAKDEGPVVKALANDVGAQ